MISARNRSISYRKALRKKRLSDQIYRGAPYYDNLHQYSKNKIHCSCPMCSAKTRNKGHRRNHSWNYDHALNYKISDLRKLERLNYVDEDVE